MYGLLYRWTALLCHFAVLVAQNGISANTARNQCISLAVYIVGIQVRAVMAMLTFFSGFILLGQRRCEAGCLWVYDLPISIMIYETEDRDFYRVRCTLYLY